ncbi:hypothetical protein HZH68_001975 [Vespula germanica]|uniref:Uncharacterized protein n=1 Tax=Vespula germanica TaxID=30212 RepID=A0A834KX21_VESGE|nr:hypothetical protein HZH68_001975 [Vespula germanica]
MKKGYLIVDEATKVTKHCYGPDLARAHFAAEFVISANKISLRLVDRVGLLDCVYKREGKRRWRRRRLEEEEEKEEEEEEEEEEREVPQKERAASIDGPREVRGSRGKWGVGLS